MKKFLIIILGLVAVSTSALAAGNCVPYSDGAYDLGTTTKEWKDGYFDGKLYTDGLQVDGAVTHNGDSTIDGNLTVQTNATINGDLSLNGDATVGTNLTAGGTVDAAAVTVDAGAGIDNESAGTLAVGAATATKVEIADSGVETEIQGTLDVQEAATFVGTVSAEDLASTDDGSVADDLSVGGIASVDALAIDITAIATDTTITSVSDFGTLSVDSSGAGVSVTLPDANDVLERVISIVVSTAGNTVTIDTDGTDTFDGTNNRLESAGVGDTVMLQAVGANLWAILSNYSIDTVTTQ